ncbi:uncharacterized protein [Lolium perenne]|uniref:uncharacterized protein isoform X2 n=1 Tax=Lolium perenne TaxID=4522 RepID=UPI0021F5B2BC|nr:uncharacterized protein LOC127308914 isoform X2 [Lolium perenne]
MSDEGGAEMTSRRRLHSAPAAPLDGEDLLCQILVRIPPLPSSLPRAGAVSKLWARVAADPGFRRRFLAHHRKPPVLGVFEKLGQDLVFSPILDPPDRIPPGRFSLCPEQEASFTHWTLLGCRHGRVLAIGSFSRHATLLVFDPVSRGRSYVPVPMDFRFNLCNVRGTVLCAAGNGEGHVHGDCHSGPFKVVLLGTRSRQEPAMACVYSSETGVWGPLVSTAEPCGAPVSRFPCTLIGSALYWWLNDSEDAMLEFDLDAQRLAVVRRPIFAGIGSSCIRIIRAEGGGVGFAVLVYPSFQLWGRKFSSDGVATWMLQRIVNMHEVIGLPSGIETRNEAIVGYSEDADVVLISVSTKQEHSTKHQHSAFIVQLDSMQSRELSRSFLEHSYHPFAYFYTAGTAKA